MDGDTYPYPVSGPGWVCFHCGERFTTPGSAEDHFGESPDKTAACRIKVGEERGLVMALRREERRHSSKTPKREEVNMGGLSAIKSMNRVIDAHGEEIRKELALQMPDELSAHFAKVGLETQTYGIQVHWIFETGSLQGPLMDIDDLAELYPDCDVGY